MTVNEHVSQQFLYDGKETKNQCFGSSSYVFIFSLIWVTLIAAQWLRLNGVYCCCSLWVSKNTRLWCKIHHILYIIVLFKGTVSHFLVEDILSTHKYTLKCIIMSSYKLIRSRKTGNKIHRSMCWFVEAPVLPGHVEYSGRDGHQLIMFYVCGCRPAAYVARQRLRQAPYRFVAVRVLCHGGKLHFLSAPSDSRYKRSHLCFIIWEVVSFTKGVKMWTKETVTGLWIKQE